MSTRSWRMPRARNDGGGKRSIADEPWLDPRKLLRTGADRTRPRPPRGDLGRTGAARRFVFAGIGSGWRHDAPIVPIRRVPPPHRLHWPRARSRFPAATPVAAIRLGPNGRPAVCLLRRRDACPGSPPDGGQDRRDAVDRRRHPQPRARSAVLRDGRLPSPADGDRHLRRPAGAPWRRLGGLRFVVGAFGVAVVRNVPLDTVLATDTPSGQEGAKRRERYPARRTARNRARTPAAGGAATIPTLALALRSEEEPAPGHRGTGRGR